MNSMISARFALSAWPRTLLLAGLVSMASPLTFGQMQLSSNRSRPFGPDACGPADPSYIRAANETGGIPLFLHRSEAAKSFHLMREPTKNNVETVLWATGTLDGQPKTIRIPVDSVTKRITFTFSEDTKGNTLKLTQPSGGSITGSTASTEITELNCGRIATVSSPEAGEWRAEIAGTGTYWLTVQAQSDIFFVSAEFVKRGGRPGHEGLFRIQGQPVAGTSAMLDVSLSGGATGTNEFYLVSEEGQTIQELQMHAVNSEEFVGSVDLPPQPFRVAVKGSDANGKQYQRFFSNLFHAESVEVSPPLDFDEVSSGSTKQLAFAVRNLGVLRTFKITVTDAHQFVGTVEPKELTLGAGETGTVRVNLTIPAGTAAGVGDNLVFLATSVAGPATSNSSIVRFSVSSASAQDDR
jgi:von Willebrand factor A domain-containing protein 7